MSLPNYMEPVDDVNNNNNNNGDADNNENENNNNNMHGGASFGDEELDSENQEAGSSQNTRLGKRKRYNRHTPEQIQELENFFKECPHPDDKQRKELSRQLGLEHLQIKFWFQNKRTQNKNIQERRVNLQLREENTRLTDDSIRYREALLNASCPKCGGRTAVAEMSFEEHHLLLENAKLTKEIRQLSEVATKYTGKSVMSFPVMSPPNQAPPFELPMITNGSIGNLSVLNMGMKEADKPLLIELAIGAMAELMALAQMNEPLWKGGVYGTILDLNEYTRRFQNGLGPRPIGYRTEASRETATVFMQHMNIVHRLMDVNLWSTMFAGMVGRAMTHDTFLTGVHENLDGTIHLMSAEYQVLSPLVSTRQCYFVRYCKQHGEGLWAVVDISIDHLIPNLELKFRRRPSGCLIQHIPEGFSRVTWVDHVEVDDRGELHHMFKHFLNSGQALGANRWVATLDRQCERLAIMMAPNIASTEHQSCQITVTNNAKQGMLKLAERMSRGFFNGVTTSTAGIWCNFPDYTGDNVRVMTRKSLNDPGRPEGVILCAAHSFWVPVPPITVFEYLRDEKNRINWDVIFHGETPQKVTHIFNGRDDRNCVTLLRSQNTDQSKMMMIQESSTEPTASFMVYAPVDVSSMEKVLNGGDPEYVPLLPSGFAILPDGMAQPGKAGGSLVNVSFQMLVDSSPSGMLTFSSVSTIESLILAAANNIKAYLTQQTA